MMSVAHFFCDTSVASGVHGRTSIVIIDETFLYCCLFLSSLQITSVMPEDPWDQVRYNAGRGCARYDDALHYPGTKRKLLGCEFRPALGCGSEERKTPRAVSASLVDLEHLLLPHSHFG